MNQQSPDTFTAPPATLLLSLAVGGGVILVNALLIAARWLAAPVRAAGYGLTGGTS